MLQKLKQTLFILLAIAFIAELLPVGLASALVNSCRADFDNNQINTNSTEAFNLTVQNTDVVDYQWIQITIPPIELTVQNVSADNGWNITQSSNTVVFSGNSLSPGNSFHATITLASGSDPGSSQLAVSASDDPGGANPTACNGQQNITIVPVPPNISNINLSNLTDNSVTVNWDTDAPSDSTVSYGLDQNYGTNVYDGTQTASHSVNLTGLAPNTFYHYQVTSTNNNGTAQSGDNTFLTPSPSPVNQSNTSNSPSSPIEIQVTNPNDKIPPTISFTSTLPKVVSTVPNITGEAADNEAVVRLEYSTDGGLDWLPVDSAPNLGGKQVNFSFTPLNLDDGTYTIEARAIDPGGNITVTPPLTTVLDRLQPIVGGNVISFGPQVLEPDGNGVVHTVAGIDLHISLSVVGGPTGVNLSLSRIGKGKAFASSYSLTQSSDSGLWSGLLSFSQAGQYQLVANAVDGAGNRTTRAISTVSVAAPGSVKANNKILSSAAVTVYYLEPESQSWVIWDGSAYGEVNPQTTNRQGSYSLFLPAGKYYLKVKAKGFQTLTSSIFSLSSASPVANSLSLTKENGLRLGPIHIPWFDFATTPINTAGQNVASRQLSKLALLGKTAPDFSLSDLEGNTVHTVDLLGEPTDLVFLTTWAPSTSDQLPMVGKLEANRDIHVEPIALGQSLPQVENYDSFGGYSANWLVDPDNSTAAGFSVGALPVHYFIDRNGVVRKIVPGVLNQQQILNELGGL